MNNDPYRQQTLMPAPWHNANEGGYAMLPPQSAPAGRHFPWKFAAVAALAIAAGMFVWQGGHLALPPFITLPRAAEAPWWAGTWTSAEGKDTPVLTLRGDGRAITGEITFRLNDGYMVRLPLLWAAANAESGLAFCLPPSQGLGPGEPCYLLAPAGQGSADLYRLLNVNNALRRGGQGSVVIPVNPGNAHLHLGQLIRAGDLPSRLDPPPAKQTPKKGA